MRGEPGLDALRSDPTMQSLMVKYGDLRLKKRPPFAALSRSIIAQQISTKAADTIRLRITESFGTAPEAFATASLSRLRSIGLSQGKARCLQDVAVRTVAGEFDSLESLADDAICARLCRINGIGPWTSQMFLIFCLARRDVWPVVDAGLRVAARREFGVDSRLALNELGARFTPTRSIAALYLWRSLENTTTGPAMPAR